ncbi:MAG: hypothetical protein PUC32_04245 [Oscillospiraceae bacterium]|nr:hypothetical protein [Oscillospiraceae bacterium]
MAMDNETRKMQQDAIHRVQEMQSRAKQHLREEAAPEKEKKSPAPRPTEDPPAAPPAGTLFDGLMQDSERTMILLLMMLLFTENADPSVIFSLLYLIL